MEYIKPCPFCGNSVAPVCHDENEIDYLSGDEAVTNPYFAVVCSVNEDSPVPQDYWKPGCGATGGYAATKEHAIEKWNRRREAHEAAYN